MSTGKEIMNETTKSDTPIKNRPESFGTRLRCGKCRRKKSDTGFQSAQQMCEAARRSVFCSVNSPGHERKDGVQIHLVNIARKRPIKIYVEKDGTIGC